MKIAIILGTRPEIIKMAPLVRLCQKKRCQYFIIHTNQHYSFNLDKIFFKELNLPLPKYNLKIGSGAHGEQTGKMLIKIEGVLRKERPTLALVEGDTNTVLAGALSAAKLQIKVGHLEAGLRSYFKEMPEEINRILTDHCSDFLFAPTKTAQNILLSEGIAKEKIFTVGNTIVDAVRQNLKIAKKKSRALKMLNLEPRQYFLVTLHRQENVDDKKRLKNILQGLELVCQTFKQPMIFPIHPRTLKMAEFFNLALPKRITIIKPVGFLDFLNLEANSSMVLTDSGGVQEETCILKVPCVTLRDNTERPETLRVKSNLLAGADPGQILKGVKIMLKRKRNWRNPFGDGRTAEKIIKILTKHS